jgi:hypothetical protein
METDGFIPGDGFYFDDFTVKLYDNNTLGSTDNTSEDITVYPNPFSTNGFRIQVPNNVISEVSQLQLIDVLGRNMELMYNLDNNTIVVNKISSLGPGIYFIRLMDTKGRVLAVKKLIKL